MRMVFTKAIFLKIKLKEKELQPIKMETTILENTRIISLTATENSTINKKIHFKKVIGKTVF